MKKESNVEETEVTTEEIVSENTESSVESEQNSDLDELKKEVEAEEALIEEVSVEEPVEEEPVEEKPVEGKPIEEKPIEEKPKKRVAAKVLAIIGIVLVVLIAAYFGAAYYFSNHFFLKTSVNGHNCAGMTVEEVEALMQTQVDEYVLHMKGRDGKVEEIKGKDIDMRYNRIDLISDAMEAQNELLWVVGFYEDSPIEATIEFVYDESKLDALISELDCVQKENQVAPVSAKPVYDGNAYVIEPENLGAQIDLKKLNAGVDAAIAKLDEELDLHTAGCYVEPKFTEDSEEIIAVTEALNTCIQSDITYSLADITVEVDKEDIVDWISADQNAELKFNKKKMMKFIDKLCKEYNTPDGTQKIVTPTGKKASVPNGKKGRKVGREAEYKQLKKDIQLGEMTIREPILSQRETAAGEVEWGDTYLEVDIAQQHMWYIKDGEVVFESDVVTGSPGRDTPTGYFTILEKLSPKILRGYYPNGKLEYETRVQYWARVTWSGVGFHDATWQAKFGGQRYRQGYGSHGCINMPYGKIAQLYGMIKKGCPVVIHK